MPKIISQMINESLPGLWKEENAYIKKNLYNIDSGKLPPVNYDSHILNSHSLTHIESPLHTKKGGNSIDQELCNLEKFYGNCHVIKLTGDHYKKIDEITYHWEVTFDQLKNGLGANRPKKLLLTTENYPKNKFGFHDPNYVLTLSIDAAEYLVSLEGFNLYGTTWKSSDYKPGCTQRPIHNKLFEKAIILECLNLSHVEPGEYFLNAFPLPIEQASESPVCAVLFEYDEIINN